MAIKMTYECQSFPLVNSSVAQLSEETALRK